MYTRRTVDSDPANVKRGTSLHREFYTVSYQYFARLAKSSYPNQNKLGTILSSEQFIDTIKVKDKIFNQYLPAQVDIHYL